MFLIIASVLQMLRYDWLPMIMINNANANNGNYKNYIIIIILIIIILLILLIMLILILMMMMGKLHFIFKNLGMLLQKTARQHSAEGVIPGSHARHWKRQM